MKRLLRYCLVLATVMGSTAAIHAAEPHISREAIEWCNQIAEAIVAREGIAVDDPTIGQRRQIPVQSSRGRTQRFLRLGWGSKGLLEKVITWRRR